MASCAENVCRRLRALKLPRIVLAVVVAALNCRMGLPAESPPISPLELFRFGGIEEAQFQRLADGDPWQEADRQALRSVLYRIAQNVRPVDMENWSHGAPSLDRLAEQPGAYRAEVFKLRGRVARIEPCDLAASSAQEVSFSRLWRCRLTLDQGGEVEILAGKTPQAWKPSAAIEERAGALAFFLGHRKGETGGSTAVFLTDRMAWYPDTYLGRLGMDVGLLDDVRVEPPPKRTADGRTPEIDWVSRRLTADDHECFYQMLAAAGRAAPGELNLWARETLKKQGNAEYSVVPLFNQPHLQKGKLVELRGVAKRILPVRVGESEVIERFGINLYYQVYLFTGDSQDNPLVFCLRRLPKGLPTGDGPDFGEELTVAGFFFKTWSYRNAAPASDGRVQRQLAPLLIGDTAVWHPGGSRTFSRTARLAGTALVLAILGAVWFVLRRFKREDREFERRIWRRRPAEMSGIEWDRLGEAPSETPPDEGGTAPLGPSREG